jgi:glycerol kinase
VLSHLKFVSWHDHDAEEIQETADACIANATKELEKDGWAKESIKVIGALLHVLECVVLFVDDTLGYCAGVTNQRETAVAWSRKTGKPLCKAIVWTDSRTKNLVAHFEHKLKTTGIETQKRQFANGKQGVKALKQMYVFTFFRGAKD